MTKKNRAPLTIEEKILKTLNALFMLQAAQLKMSNADMRKLLGLATTDINAVTKVINKTLKKHGKGTTKRNP